MKNLLALALIALPLFSGDGKADDRPVRMALDSLPLSFGVPYRTSVIPSIYVTAALFDGLTRIDPDGTLKPWLATGWESSDGVTWRFTLRDDVKFSNGAPLTAEAFAVAANYLSTDEAIREGLRREITPLKGGRVIDDHTVEITLAEPDATFPRSASALYVAEPGAWQTMGRDQFGQTPVGTGPFQLVRWEANKAVLKAFEGSWRKPKINDLEIVAVPDRASRLQALIAGQVDIAVGLAAGDMDIVEANGGKGLRFASPQVAGWYFMLIRDGKPVDTPMQDVRVRRAMAMAIDRKLIVDALMYGEARLATQPSTAAAYGHNPDLKPLPYDPEAAKKLLTEAGYPNGFEMTFMATSGAVGVDTEVAQKAADDLSRIGIKVTILTEPVPQFLQHLSRATFPTDAFTGAWPAEPSMDAIRTMRLHSCLRREPFYCDQRIMPAIERAMTTMDEAEGLRLRHEVMKFYHDEVSGIYFFDGTVFVGAADYIDGMSMAHNIIAFDQIRSAR
ncbi:MAG: ABC transporter substrate-binding protein [Rhodobacteraceae bacterium]|nr:ABC transporter substrate-binding protein [Paracoccaceae bacterium]